MSAAAQSLLSRRESAWLDELERVTEHLDTMPSSVRTAIRAVLESTIVDDDAGDFEVAQARALLVRLGAAPPPLRVIR